MEKENTSQIDFNQNIGKIYRFLRVSYGKDIDKRYILQEPTYPYALSEKGEEFGGERPSIELKELLGALLTSSYVLINNDLLSEEELDEVVSDLRNTARMKGFSV